MRVSWLCCVEGRNDRSFLVFAHVRTIPCSSIGSYHGNSSSATPVLAALVCQWRQITLDAFGLAALSYEFNCTKSFDKDEVAGAFEYLLQELAARMFGNPLDPFVYFYSLPTARNKKWHEANNIVNGLLKKIVHAHQKTMDAEAKKAKVRRLVGASSCPSGTTVDWIVLTPRAQLGISSHATCMLTNECMRCCLPRVVDACLRAGSR